MNHPDFFFHCQLNYLLTARGFLSVQVTTLVLSTTTCAWQFLNLILSKAGQGLRKASKCHSLLFIQRWNAVQLNFMLPPPFFTSFLFWQLNSSLFFPQRMWTGLVIFWVARKWFGLERYKTDLQEFSLEISTKQTSLARLHLNHGSNEKELPSSLVDWVLDVTTAIWTHV